MNVVEAVSQEASSRKSTEAQIAELLAPCIQCRRGQARYEGRLDPEQ